MQRMGFFHVNATDLEAAELMVSRARSAFLAQFPEARFRATRLPQGGSESGIVYVEIFGPDAEVLMTAAEKVSASFAGMPSVVKNETDWGHKIIKIVINIAQDKAREFGVTSEDISGVMAAYFSGTEYSTFREGDRPIDLCGSGAEAYAASVSRSAVSLKLPTLRFERTDALRYKQPLSNVRN